MKAFADTTLLLLGHGSARNPHTRTPLDTCAAALRARNLFADVQVAFLKEPPLIEHARARLATTRTIAVPCFISHGYYTREVIPQLLDLANDATHIRYLPPIGQHPAMADLIIARAHEAGADTSATLAVLGHGTPRNPHSAENIFLQANRVRASNRFAEVAAVFIDQEPHLETLFNTPTQTPLFIVPFFIADGWHVTETLPADLLRSAPNRSFTCTPSVGTDPALPDVVLDHTHSAG